MIFEAPVRGFYASLVLAVASLASSCEPRPATALVVRFATDVEPARARRVALTLRWDEPGSSEFAMRDYVLGGGAGDAGGLRFPGSVVVAPVEAREAARAARALHVQATLFATASDGATRAHSTARALVRLTDERTVAVDLFFADLCATSGTNARCTTAESCTVSSGQAQCAPVALQDRLPQYQSDASIRD